LRLTPSWHCSPAHGGSTFFHHFFPSSLKKGRELFCRWPTAANGCPSAAQDGSRSGRDGVEWECRLSGLPPSRCAVRHRTSSPLSSQRRCARDLGHAVASEGARAVMAYQGASGCAWPHTHPCDSVVVPREEGHAALGEFRWWPDLCRSKASSSSQCWPPRCASIEATILFPSCRVMLADLHRDMVASRGSVQLWDPP
jgi:hypothetical protein